MEVYFYVLYLGMFLEFQGEVVQSGWYEESYFFIYDFQGIFFILIKFDKIEYRVLMSQFLILSLVCQGLVRFLFFQVLLFFCFFYYMLQRICFFEVGWGLDFIFCRVFQFYVFVDRGWRISIQVLVFLYGVGILLRFVAYFYYSLLLFVNVVLYVCFF